MDWCLPVATACRADIPLSDSHKDLGFILSDEDLSWDKHYKTITSCAYKLKYWVGLICQTFQTCIITMFKVYNQPYWLLQLLRNGIQLLAKW